MSNPGNTLTTTLRTALRASLRAPQPLGACLLLLATTLLAAPTPAQDTNDGGAGASTPAKRWSLAAGGGSASTGDQPSGNHTFDNDLFGSEAGEFSTDYQGGDASAQELTVGYRVRGAFAIGITWSSTSIDDRAAVEARLPHPFLFDRHREVSGSATSLSRDETALHLSLRWVAADREKMEFGLFAGPSSFDLDYELVSAVRFDQIYPFDTATWAGVEQQSASGSATGFHVGMDLAWYFNDTVGIGAVARWSDATVDLDAPDGTALTADAGGTHLGLDLRFRF